MIYQHKLSKCHCHLKYYDILFRPHFLLTFRRVAVIFKFWSAVTRRRFQLRDASRQATGPEKAPSCRRTPKTEQLDWPQLNRFIMMYSRLRTY
jgi:hypothetical protein